MASTYSARVRLELQATGENSATWGTRLNDNALSLVDDAIGAYTTIDLSSATVTLTANNGATDQSRSPMLLLNGTLTSNVGVVFPSVTQGRWVRNATSGSFSVTAKTLGGTGYTVPQGKIVHLICDSVSVFPGTVAVSIDVSSGLGTAAYKDVGTSLTQLPDVSLANTLYAQLASANAFTSGTNTFRKQVVSPTVTLTDAASIAWDMATGNTFLVSLAGNRTLAYPSNVSIGQSGIVYFVQDGTGSRTLSFNSSFKFTGANAPTLTTTASAVDAIGYNVRAVSAIDCNTLLDLR